LQEHSDSITVTDGRCNQWREVISIQIPNSLIIARTMQGDDRVLLRTHYENANTVDKVTAKVQLKVPIGQDMITYPFITITTYRHVAEKFQFKYEVLDNIQSIDNVETDFDIDSM